MQLASQQSHFCKHATSRDIFHKLVDAGYRFDFFQAVWIIERLLLPNSPVGCQGPAQHEVVSFRPHLSMGFPPTDVRAITSNSDDNHELQHFFVDVTFLGLYGVSTPLPLDYSVRVLRSVQRCESTGAKSAERIVPGALLDTDRGHSPLRDFLDLVHNRLLSLFYRTFTKYRYDKSFGMGHCDKITTYILWLIGCGPNSDTLQLGIDPFRLLRYCGTLTQHPRSAVSLQGVLSDYWSTVPVRVEQFAMRWVAVPDSSLNRVGKRNSSVGQDVTIGSMLFDLSGGFELQIGPVDWLTYLDFLPDGNAFRQTLSLTRLYCQDRLAVFVTIQIGPEEIPEMQLSSDSNTPRLGYTSWVRTNTMPVCSVTFATNG